MSSRTVAGKPCPVCGAGSRVVGRVAETANVCRCRRCGHTFVAAFPASEAPSAGSHSTETEHSFTEGLLVSTSALERRYAQLASARGRWYREALGKQGALSVLEVGCGSGSLGQAFERQGDDYLGIDIDHRVVEVAQARGVNVRLQDVMDLDIDGHSFDVIFLSQVLEHIKEPHEFLNHLHVLLGDRALIHLDVPNDRSLAGIPSRLLRGWGTRLGGIDYPHHCMSYTRESLSKLLLSDPGYEVSVFSATPSDPLWGQGVVPNNRARLYYRASAVSGTESLLVGVAIRRSQGVS